MEFPNNTTEGKDSPPQQWVPKGQNLVIYGPSGVYYGRAKVGKKLTYECLNTKDRTVADRRLLKFMDRIRKARNRENNGKRTLARATFKTLFTAFKKDFETDASLLPASRRAKINSLIRIENTWPELLKVKIPGASSEAFERKLPFTARTNTLILQRKKPKRASRYQTQCE